MTILGKRIASFCWKYAFWECGEYARSESGLAKKVDADLRENRGADIAKYVYSFDCLYGNEKDNAMSIIADIAKKHCGREARLEIAYAMSNFDCGIYDSEIMENLEKLTDAELLDYIASDAYKNTL